MKIRRQWIERAGRPPTRPELEAAVRDAVDEEVLVRVALAEHLERRDPVVRQRLVRNLRFLGGELAGLDDEALFRRALALGMERSDTVVRRRLAQQMRLRIAAAARQPPPARAELEAHYERHAASFRVPERLRLSHVFLAAGHEGRAPQLAAALARIEVRRAPELGDPFLLGHHLPPRSLADLARSFGPRFAAGVANLEPGAWSGPIASSYGLHWVWIHERIPAHPLPLDAVSTRVREEILAEREREAERAAVAALRTRFEIAVAASEAGA